MPAKGSGYSSVTADKETTEKIYKIAKQQGISASKLLKLLFIHETFIPTFLKLVDNLEIKGPFVRKKEDRLEQYFLVSSTEVEIVTEVETRKWIVDNVKA